MTEDRTPENSVQTSQGRPGLCPTCGRPASAWSAVPWCVEHPGRPAIMVDVDTPKPETAHAPSVTEEVNA
jgi:hypothetical protein